MTKEEAYEQRELLEKAVQTLSDNEALKIKTTYPSWEKIKRKDKPIKKGLKLRFQGKIYKTKQYINKVLNGQEPDKVPALYEVINESYKGTLEEPIPYDTNMTVYNGKYYLYSNTIYKCVRNSEQPLYNTPDKLIGNYFEVI